MSRKEKLIKRFLTLPSDFHYDEVVKLVRIYGYTEVKKGKTSGSRVKFINKENDTSIILHKPHPTGIMKTYQLKQIKKVLEL